jgi:hypothetical protein
LYWNIIHQFPSFRHVFSLAGADSSRRASGTFWEFLGSQPGLVTPVLFFIIALACVQLFRYRNKIIGKTRQALLLFWFLTIPGFLFFMLLSFWTRVEANWPGFVYLGGLMAGGWWLNYRGKLWSKLSRWGLGLAFFMTSVVHIQAVYPFIPFTQKQAKADTPARLYGWKTLANEVYKQLKSLPEGSFVGCRTYQNASQLSFYLPGNPRTVIVQPGQIRHQYRFWNQPEKYFGNDAILVVGQEWEIGEMQQFFKKVEKVSQVDIHRNKNLVNRFHIYKAYVFKAAE